jgi:hypothetical protein
VSFVMTLDIERPRDRSETDELRWLADPRVVIQALIFCPPLPNGTRYALARRAPDKTRRIVGSGMTLNSHEPLNLAIIRQRAAKLGANEVLVLERLPTLVSAPWDENRVF